MVEMIAVVIPAYRVRGGILDVISGIGAEVGKIYVVDDKCPEESGLYVQQNCSDDRVEVLFHDKNKGVGGAVKTGYRKALTDHCDIVVKIDGDGQMDPALIPHFINPILAGEADYVKGNRFFSLKSLSKMPVVRVFGNSMLSIINKFVNGYWNIMDPTNGYTAIHRAALEMIELEKVADTYFFESDMLFRLSTVRAVVYDIPMNARYENEESGLRISRILFQFPPKYLNRYFKRIFYNYFLRDFNAGTIELIVGSVFFIFGLTEGFFQWFKSIESNIAATSGTVMLAALPTILGFQLLISGLQYDIRNIPVKPLQKLSL
jgi:dolichol-phosphate mannosyltransferase